LLSSSTLTSIYSCRFSSGKSISSLSFEGSVSGCLGVGALGASPITGQLLQKCFFLGAISPLP